MTVVDQACAVMDRARREVLDLRNDVRDLRAALQITEPYLPAEVQTLVRQTLRRVAHV